MEETLEKEKTKVVYCSICGKVIEGPKEMMGKHFDFMEFFEELLEQEIFVSYSRDCSKCK